MIGWHVPAALGALGLMALPIVVHLLRTHRAQRIPFPTLRFVAPSRTSAVKLRPPSDLPLLLVRIAIIAAAALAMAQPVLVTDARVNVWNNRLARAVIVDSSQAMQIPDTSGTTPSALAKPLAAAEVAAAAHSIQIEAASLTDGLTRAAAWLITAPPARREIVVISTFRAGALTDPMLKQLPPSVGLRLIQVGHPIDSRIIAGTRPLTSPGEPSAIQDVQLTGATTSVVRKTAGGELRGARVVGLDPAMPAVQRLWRTLALAGTPAPSADRPIALAFGGWPSGERVAAFDAETPRWMLQVLMRLRSDAGLQRAAATAPASLLSASAPWVTIAVDREGAPLARLSRRAEELIMQVGAPIDSLFGAASARAMLAANAGDAARPEQEILRIAPATLEGWSRAAPPVDRQAWRSLNGSDARWLWAIALVLLAVEQWLRRSPVRQAAEVRDAA